MFEEQLCETPFGGHGSYDGFGSADHDEAYTFGRIARSVWTYPFTARQFARLLILRSTVRDACRLPRQL